MRSLPRAEKRFACNKILFCSVFVMKVNVRKSEIIIFWKKEMKLRMARWPYDGVDLKVVESAV